MKSFPHGIVGRVIFCVGLFLIGVGMLLSQNIRLSAQTTDASAQTVAPGTNVTIFRDNPERSGGLNVKIATPLSVAWQTTTNPIDNNESTPTIDNGTLFFGAGVQVFAVNAADGRIKWIFPKPGSGVAALAFHCQSTVNNGKVYIGNDNGNLYALDEETGEEIWHFTAGGAIRSAPVVDNGAIFFGATDNKVYAIRLDNQQPLWGGEFRVGGQVFSPVVISRGLVYFTDSGNTVLCASETNGKMIWSDRFDYPVGDAPPHIVGTTLIIGADHLLYGLTARTGQTLWSISFPQAISGAPASAPGKLDMYITTTDGTLYALGTRGVIRWKTNLFGAPTSAITVTQNAVITCTKTGVIAAFDVDSGRLLWRFATLVIAPPYNAPIPTHGFMNAPPLVTADSIYSLDNNGTVTAFRNSAIDSLPPIAYLAYPPTDKQIAGAQVPYSVLVGDYGSGIREDTIKLTVDGSLIPTQFDPGKNEVTVKTDVGATLVGHVPVALQTLSSGRHRLVLRVSDWRGNELKKVWYFDVDSSLNPKGSAPPPPPKSNNGASDSSSDPDDTSSSSNLGGNSSTNDAINSGSNLPSTAGVPGGSVPGSAGASSSDGSSSGGAGSGPSPSGSGPSAPVPPIATGGGGSGGPTPAPPPPTSSFPPPPPI